MDVVKVFIYDHFPFLYDFFSSIGSYSDISGIRGIRLLFLEEIGVP